MADRRHWMKQVASGAAVLALGPHELAWGAQLVAVRVWPANEYTRVTLESDVPLNATFFSVPNPHRLVIDVEGLEISAQLKELVSKIQADDPFIAGVRMGQNRPRVVRLVIDLKQAIKPQVFGLPPVAAYQHRLVFDLYPSVPATTALNAPAAAGSKAPAPAAPRASNPTGAPAHPGAPTPPASPTAGPAASAASQGSASGGGDAAVASGGSPGAWLSPTPPQASVGAPTGHVTQPAASASAPGSGQLAEAMNDALGDFIGNLRKAPDTSAKAPGLKPGDRAADRGTARAPERGDHPAAPVPPAVAEVNPGHGNTRRLVIVAIDAGHGGEDPGAIGPSGLYEKDVVLKVAHKLRAQINAQPGMRAMLTRDADYFVPLQERVAKARRVQADLFVSIHADAFMNAQARGASVFALSDKGATSAAARWMAKRENASDMVGGVNIKAKDATVLRALLDMSTTAQIKDSIKLGRDVLGSLGKVGRLHNGQVEQAGFAVLKAPDIPSILVETGFITNPEEEAKLKDPDYQEQLAQALLSGIQRYFAKNPPLARDRAM